MTLSASESNLLGWLLIATTCSSCAFSVKKVGWLPYPTLFIMLVAIAQSVLALAKDGVLTYEMLAVFDMGGMRQNYIFVQAIYTGIAIFSVASLCGRYKQIKEIKLDAGKLVIASQSKWARLGTNIAIAIVVAHFFLFLIIMDWEIIWFHQQYLASLVKPQSIEIFGVMGVNTVFRSLLMIAALSAVTYCVAANAKRKSLKIVAGMFTIFYFVLLFSVHSRSAVLLPFLVGMNAFIAAPNRRFLIVPTMVLVSIFTLSSALDGRARSAHGISAIPDSFAVFFSEEILINIGDVFVNLSEGAFTTVESLQINQPFMEKYRILALSPLPSFLDGYSNIREIGEHRLHKYVPMSGYAEAILFGMPYAMAFLVILFAAARLHARLASISPSLFLFCNCLQLFAMHYMFAYPMRSGLRFIWLEIFLAVVALATIKNRKANEGVEGALYANVINNKAKSVVKKMPYQNVINRKVTIGVSQVDRHD